LRCASHACTVFTVIHAAEEIREHRAQPVEKKSQRNSERHFRSAAHASAKSDGNFTDTQPATSAHDRFENDFETACLWRQFQQSRTANGKEAAHGIVEASEGICKRRTRSRYHPAPHWPALCGSAFDIAASDH